VNELDRLNEFLLQSPLHVWLGCRIVARDAGVGTVDVFLPDREELHRLPGDTVAHGGVLAALADIAAHAALQAKTGYGIPTIDMRMDYLRLARLPLTARARVVRNGQNIGFADIEIFDRDGTLSALGRAVFFTRAAPTSP
jgi:uncharacterized protein (TIGR00369 family)